MQAEALQFPNWSDQTAVQADLVPAMDLLFDLRNEGILSRNRVVSFY